MSYQNGKTESLLPKRLAIMGVMAYHYNSKARMETSAGSNHEAT